MAWQDEEWVSYVSVSLKIALALAVGYVAFDWLTRPSVGPSDAEVRERPLQADLYVVPPKTNITRYATAQRLVGMDLWVRGGWGLAAQPGDRWLAPLEKITPTRVFERDGDLLIRFEKAGRPAELVVGKGGAVYVDELLFSKDPRELYGHWSEETWKKIEAGEAEPGMSEFQVGFALGSGTPVDVSPGGATRVVEYRAREVAGLAPMRVVFRGGIADTVEPAPSR